MEHAPLRLAALELYMEAMGVTAEDSLLLKHAAVYLGQAIGEVDLGFRFTPYGPISDGLTVELNALESYSPGEASSGRKLRPDVRNRLWKVRDILNNISRGLTRRQWAQALATYDYARRVNKLSKAEAAEIVTLRLKDLNIPTGKRLIDTLENTLGWQSG